MPAYIVFLATKELHESVGVLSAWLTVHLRDSWLICACVSIASTKWQRLALYYAH